MSPAAKKAESAAARKSPQAKAATRKSPKAARKPTLKKRMERLSGDMIDKGIRLDEALEQLEKCFLEQVLREESGNQTRAAQRLDLHRNTLRRKMERHGLK